ncbi:hypothetical protein ACHAWO_008993 [Cyclotella atomus]|uniref:Uncharacterized protein n=1 Tax=Cyclotella atomus TaxID=382360 RepID=A0ABD3Q8M9_9STRA
MKDTMAIGCDTKGTEGHRYPPTFHTSGKTVVRGILTRGEDLEKRDILGFEGIFAQLLLAHTGETPQLFRSMGFPFHNKVPCGAQSWMIGSEEVRIARQTDTLSSSDAYYRQQAGNRAQADKARSDAKVIANLLVEKGALRLINGVPVFDKGTTFTLFNRQDLQYALDNFSELENIKVSGQAYGYVMEEFLIKSGIEITRSNNTEEAILNTRARRVQCSITWNPPSEQLDMRRVKSLIKDLITQIPASVNIIVFVESELTDLLGAPGIVSYYTNKGKRYLSYMRLFAEGKMIMIDNYKDLENKYKEKAREVAASAAESADEMPAAKKPRGEEK